MGQSPQICTARQSGTSTYEFFSKMFQYEKLLHACLYRLGVNKNDLGQAQTKFLGVSIAKMRKTAKRQCGTLSEKNTKRAEGRGAMLIYCDQSYPTAQGLMRVELSYCISFIVT